MDGRLEADGLAGSIWGAGEAYGGGAGGSILISAQEITGTGTIRLGGGTGGSASFAQGGNGSSGRLALYFDVAGVQFPTIENLNGSVVIGPEINLGNVEMFAPGCAPVQEQNVFSAGIPMLGGSFQFLWRYEQGPGISTLLIGLGTSSFNGAPLPLDLTPFGASGCTLYHDAVLAFRKNTVLGGPTGWNFALNNDPSLVGFEFYSSVLSNSFFTGQLVMSETLKSSAGG